MQKQAKRHDILVRKVYYAGDVVFHEGDEGSTAYVIQSGRIEIVKNRNGSPVLLGTLGKGAIFGEMALIDDAPRMATARAAEQTIVMLISGRVFRDKMSEADPFFNKLLRIMVQNVRSLADGDVTELVEQTQGP